MVETPVGAQRRDLPTTSGEWEHVAADDDTGTHPGHPAHGDTGASPEYNPFTESTGPPHDDPPQQPATEPTGPPQPAVPGAAVLPPIGGTNASSAASSYTSETDGDGEVSPTPVYSPTRQEKEAETESAPGHDAATPGVKEDKAKSAQGHDAATPGVKKIKPNRPRAMIHSICLRTCRWCHSPSPRVTVGATKAAAIPAKSAPLLLPSPAKILPRPPFPIMRFHLPQPRRFLPMNRSRSNPALTGQVRPIPCRRGRNNPRRRPRPCPHLYRRVPA